MIKLEFGKYYKLFGLDKKFMYVGQIRGEMAYYKAHYFLHVDNGYIITTDSYAIKHDYLNNVKEWQEPELNTDYLLKEYDSDEHCGACEHEEQRAYADTKINDKQTIFNMATIEQLDNITDALSSRSEQLHHAIEEIEELNKRITDMELRSKEQAKHDDYYQRQINELKVDITNNDRAHAYIIEAANILLSRAGLPKLL
jgi:hypothetical protein